MRAHAVGLLAIPSYRRFDRIFSDTRPSPIDETSVAWMTGTATVVACMRQAAFDVDCRKHLLREQYQERAISRLKDNSTEGSNVSNVNNRLAGG